MEEIYGILTTVIAGLLLGGSAGMLKLYLDVRVQKVELKGYRMETKKLDIEYRANRSRLEALADAMMESFVTGEVGKKLKENLREINDKEDQELDDLLKNNGE